MPTCAISFQHRTAFMFRFYVQHNGYQCCKYVAVIYNSQSENLFGGIITWALEVPSYLHLSLTIEQNVDTGQLLCTNCWHFFGVCHCEISTGHNSMSYTHSEGCTDLHSVAFTVIFSVLGGFHVVGKQSIFLSVYLLITNFILAIVKKYDPFLFKQVLFHVIMYVRLTIGELGTLHSFWG